MITFLKRIACEPGKQVEICDLAKVVMCLNFEIYQRPYDHQILGIRSFVAAIRGDHESIGGTIDRMNGRDVPIPMF